MVESFGQGIGGREVQRYGPRHSNKPYTFLPRDRRTLYCYGKKYQLCLSAERNRPCSGGGRVSGDCSGGNVVQFQEMVCTGQSPYNVTISGGGPLCVSYTIGCLRGSAAINQGGLEQAFNAGVKLTMREIRRQRCRARRRRSNGLCNVLAMTASSTQRRHHGTGGTAGRPRSGTTWYDNRRQCYSAYQSDYGLQY